MRNSPGGRGGSANVHLYESFVPEAARSHGLSAPSAQFFNDQWDKKLMGFTLLEEFPGMESGELFEVSHGGGMVLRSEYSNHQGQLLEAFAQWNAYFDLLRKTDRRIITSGHYPSNMMVHIGKDGVDLFGIDQEFLFTDQFEEYLLNNIRGGFLTEIGFVSTLPGFENAETRERLLRLYKTKGLSLMEPGGIDSIYGGLCRCRIDYTSTQNHRQNKKKRAKDG